MISILSWKSTPVNIDEYYTVFIARGIPIGCFWGGDGREFITANPCIQQDTISLALHSTWLDTYTANAKDGGNGILYYSIAHIWSEYAGPKLGMFNSLRILSFIFSLISLIIVSYILYTKFGIKGELIGGLFYISVAVPNLLFVRTYALSTLFVLIFIAFAIKLAESEFEIRSCKKHVLFYFIVISLPFLHFFNVFFLLLYVGFILYKWFKGLSIKRIYPVLLPFILSVSLISVYYFTFNREGRIFQNQLTDWYTEISNNSSLKEYKPSIKLSTLNVIKKNIWAGARTAGLKLNQPHFRYPYYSLMQIISYLLLLIYILSVFFFLTNIFFIDNTYYINLSIYILLGYFLFINILSIKLGNLVIFNEQYFFALFPITTLLFSAYYSGTYTLNPIYKRAQVLILSLIMINCLVYCFLPPEVSIEKTYSHKSILNKLENPKN